MNMGAKFCGLDLEHPFILASAPPTASVEMIERAFAAGWAGAVTKTLKPDSLEVQDATPRFSGMRMGKRIAGFENFELVSRKSLSYWEEGIARLRDAWPGKLLIVSIMGGSTRESWQELARWAERAGAQALELNFSCPHGMPEKGLGAAIGQNPETTRAICGWVKKAVGVPVMVKLSPNVTDIGVIARAAEEAGADALAAINTVECLMGVDLESLNPLPDVGGASAYGGYSGPGVKPIGLRVIAQLRNITKLPLSGIGGISTWKDAAEYISLGAHHVQICTEVMLSGFGIVDALRKGLEGYLESKGFDSLDRLRGVAAAKMRRHADLPRRPPVVPRVDRARCVACGACVTACSDGAYQAIRMEGSAARIDAIACDGCGLCALVCPVDAIIQPA
jgi:dihydropyrimidine dehydrogenase (NAD+) subunit PreA